MNELSTIFSGEEYRDVKNAYKHLFRAMKSSEFAAEFYHLGSPTAIFICTEKGAAMISTSGASRSHCVRDLIFDRAIGYFSKCPSVDDIDKPGLFAQCSRAEDVGCSEAIREMDDEE